MQPSSVAGGGDQARDGSYEGPGEGHEYEMEFDK